MGHRADEGLSAAEGVFSEELSSPKVSLLCRECGNGAAPSLGFGEDSSFPVPLEKG